MGSERVGLRARGVGLVAASLVLVVGLVAGCNSGGEPIPEVSSSAVRESPSEYPSLPSTVHVSFYPITSGPPKDAGKAIEYALRVAKLYYKARTAYRADPSRKDDALLVYASGPQAEADIALVEHAQQNGIELGGEYRFEPDEPSAYTLESAEVEGQGETPIPHGVVMLPGCQDITGLSASINGEGEYSHTGPDRYWVVLTVLYFPAVREWKLYDITVEEESGEKKAC